MKSFILSAIPALVAAGPGINPNPNPNFNPATSQGTFGPFNAAQKAASSANGGPTNLDPRTLQAMQLAISNWQTDTGIVSGMLNVGKNTADSNAFKGIADGAFKAEVDELSQKAVLDKVIGNDPRVSIANLTLTNGCFQSVVDNLQIMSIQGQSKQNLIDAINTVRCTQVLPSIDTYMIVAAEYIGANAQQRRAVRPAGCTAVLAAANSTSFPNVPGTPNGTPAGKGDGNVQGVPGACSSGAGTLASGNSTSNANGGNRNSGSNAGTSSSSSSTTGSRGNGSSSNSTSTSTTKGSGNTNTNTNGSSSNSTSTSTTKGSGNTNTNTNGSTKGGKGTAGTTGTTGTTNSGNTTKGSTGSTNAGNTAKGTGNGANSAGQGTQAAKGQGQGAQAAKGQGTQAAKGQGAQAAKGQGTQAAKGQTGAQAQGAQAAKGQGAQAQAKGPKGVRF